MSQASLLQAALDPMRDRPEELIEIVLRQAGMIERLQKELAELKQQIKEINDRNDGLSPKVEELARKAARQAAPFRIEEQPRVVERKKPGRPHGHPGVCRAVPDHVDEEIVVPLAECPHLTSPRTERKHQFHWGFVKKCSK